MSDADRRQSGGDEHGWPDLAGNGRSPGADPASNGHRHLGSDEAVVVGLARGLAYSEVATMSGLSERSVRRRASAATIQAAVAQHRALILESAAAEMRLALGEAVAHARAVLADEDQPGGTRLKAAALVLSHSPAVIGLDNAERRLAAVEAAMERQESHASLVAWQP